jgi:glutamyl-tRNA reductase
VLEDLGIVGVSWRQNGSESLQGFLLPAEDQAARLRDFAARLSLAELAYLATCNRVELIFSRGATTPRDIRAAAFELLTGNAPVPGQAERRLRAWQGEGACEHLFLVAAGLDSAAVGEVEITGQVRDCREQAQAMGSIGPKLELLFEEALKIARQVRGETRVGAGRVSLAEIAVDKLRERIARTGGAVALIGISAMTERAALALAKSGIELIVVNRSADKAAMLAREHGAAHCSLAEFHAEPPAVEGVLTATGAGSALLDASVLERLAARTPSGEAPLLIDMAVPPDIDAAAAKRLGLERIGMDEIVAATEENRAARLVEAAQARELVDAALERLYERFAERIFGPLFGTLQNRYRHTARQGVERLLGKELKGLGSAEREAISTWAEVLARRFAHIPCAGLRGLLKQGPAGSIDAFLAGLEPEFADELRAALKQRAAGDGGAKA